ncbi:MAG: protein kinase [Planctomycetaceae bacterium]|jgi:WD40 repeat protein/serine/threonine protein kinase|nr:protein kinase [Planctomycetaceae bacterium]
MTNFETHCPNCRSTYVVDMAYQGRRAVCRNCKTSFLLIPDISSESNSSADSAATRDITSERVTEDSSFSLRDILPVPSDSPPEKPLAASKSRTKTLSGTEKATSAGMERTFSENPTAEPESLTPIWKVGDVLLGVYEVLPMPNGQPYSEGGVGVVHRVYHREWDIELAVKSPKPSVFQVESGKASYERECQTWIELGLHPNIVTCYLVRRIDGIPRLFAELVPDGSLSDWIQDKRLYQGTREEVLKRIFDIAIQFAWGLDYSHKQGVLHLDIKPANVMIAGSRVKVTDFGLARAVSAAESDGISQWEGMTPGYCSPEQHEAFLYYKAGNRHGGPVITAQSDIWSWAISILAMFHGRAPCKRGGQTAHKVFEQYLRVPRAEEKPVMPPALVTLLTRCFQVQPADRPGSMDDAAEQLLMIYEQTFHEKFPRLKPSMTVSTIESLNNRAASLLDLDKLHEAKTLFSKAFRMQPWQPQVTFNQAVNSWRNGHLTDLEMLRQLETLVRLKPEEAVTHYALGLVQRERGNLGEAKQAFLKAVELDPKKEYRRHLKATDILLDHNVRCLERYPLAADDASQGNIPFVLLSEDERLILLYTASQQLLICETKTGRPLVRFRKCNLPADGDTVFSVLSEDLSWELTQEPNNVFSLIHLKDSGGNVIEFSPVTWNSASSSNGTEIRDGKLYTVDADGKPEPLTGHDGDVLSTTSTSDGCFAVSGGADKTVRLWELKNHRCLRTFRDGEGLIKAVFISRDRSFVLSLTDHAILKLWKTHILFNEPNRIRAPIMLCLVSSSEEVSQNQSILSQLQQRAKAAAENGDYTLALQIIQKAKTFPNWESMRKELNIWEMAGRFSIRHGVDEVLSHAAFHEESEVVSSVAVSADGKTAISAGSNGVITIWDTERKAATGFLEGHHDWVRSVDTTSDGRFAVSASWDQTVKLWDTASRQLLRTFYEQIRSVGQVAFSANARHVAVSSAAGRIYLFDSLSGTKITEWQAHNAAVSAVQFSRDSRALLTAGEDGKVHLWDIHRRSPIHTLETHQCPVMAAAVSTGLTRIVSGGSDGNLHICDLTQDRITPRILKGHLGSITTLLLTADDRWIFSGSKDATIRLWNMETGILQKQLKLHHSKSVTNLAINLPCNRLISSGEDQTVRVWDIEWEYVFPGWKENTPDLEAYLRVLLNAYFPEKKTVGTEINEQVFWRIRTELEYRGFGWIRPEPLWIQLHQILWGK